MNLMNYGFLPNIIQEETNFIPARITAVHKERYDIICEYGERYARLKSSIYFNDICEEFPTTGDFVLIDYNCQGDSQIVKTLPRKTFFCRRYPSPGRGEQAVASNFDYVFIMQSLNHDFNSKRLERYLTLSWQSGAIPVIVLTKADLFEQNNVLNDYVGEVEKVASGVLVHPVSAKTGFGISELSEYLKVGKTIVLLGSSGVGKSSLVNALAGEELMDVNTIRKDDSKGKHTTTHRQLIMLKNGTMIIDTPGMRELGMWDVSTGLGEAFFDIEQHLGKCKFSDCRHQGEPGCAIKAAIENGQLSQQRWDSYNKLKREARITDDLQGVLKEKHKRNKEIAKWSKQKKKNGGFKK